MATPTGKVPADAGHMTPKPNYVGPIHKAVGVVVLGFALLRAAWRLIEGFPEAVGHSGAMQQTVAKATHWLLLIATLAMPISGLMMSLASGN